MAKVKKAQKGSNLKPEFDIIRDKQSAQKAKSSYQSTKNPKYDWKTQSPSGRALVTHSADTTGYAAGKKNFTGKRTIIDRKGEKKFSPDYFTMNRDAVTTALKEGFHKKTQTIKKFGGKVTKAKSVAKIVKKSSKKK